MTCLDCIFAIYDYPDRETGPGSDAVYCREAHKLIRDEFGEIVDDTPCEKWRRRKV